MESTEIVQKISSIIECDAKSLAQVFNEAYEKVLNFYEINEKLSIAEGVPQYYEWLKTKEAKKLFNKLVGNTKRAEAGFEPIFMEYTGMTFAEYDEEVEIRLGKSTSFFGRKGKDRVGIYHYDNGGNLNKLLNIYTNEAEKLKVEANTAALELEKSATMLIPPDYRYPLAIQTMLGFVRNLRASTWKECADLYEEQLHRWQMEENNAEHNMLLQQVQNLTGKAAAASTASAIFSGLNFFLK